MAGRDKGRADDYVCVLAAMRATMCAAMRILSGVKTQTSQTMTMTISHRQDHRP